MNQHWIEDLRFSVEVFNEGGSLLEVLGRLHDLDAARAAYEACRTKYPKKLLYLSQGGRIFGQTAHGLARPDQGKGDAVG